MDGETQAVWGCVKCARLGKTCCQRSEVLLTVGDQARIAEHTGRQDFCDQSPPENPAYADQPDDPNWLRWGFAADGTRPILARRPDGDCTFLGPTGCTLPMHVRPLVCRLYPYQYTQAGINGVAEGCPPAVVVPGTTILQTLDIHLLPAMEWHRMLYRELETKERCDEVGNHVRLAS